MVLNIPLLHLHAMLWLLVLLRAQLLLLLQGRQMILLLLLLLLVSTTLGQLQGCLLMAALTPHPIRLLYMARLSCLWAPKASLGTSHLGTLHAPHMTMCHGIKPSPASMSVAVHDSRTVMAFIHQANIRYTSTWVWG